MYTSITIGEMLRTKGSGFWSISPHASAYEALELMADKNVGALLVLENGVLVGVFSERDYARKVILKGLSSKTTTVGALMSSPPICAAPGLTLKDCMVMMTDNHVRHLPVLQNGALVGIVSIGDIVNAIISAQACTIQELENYITGNDYARGAMAHP